MALALAVVGLGAVLLAIRLFHLASQAAPPTLHFVDSAFTREIIRLCPLLTQIYLPPLLWGKSGHIQTFTYGKMGRINSPFPKGERCSSVMEDGATMTYDVFPPLVPHTSGGDYSLLVCPGIANHSESLYIRTFVYHAQSNGFRVAVLNHLGALKEVPLTSPRIFTYGGTGEYGRMVMEVNRQFPGTQCIAVGFSMGANIVLKYIGEERGNQAKFIAAVSCCQGYDAEEVMPYLTSWEHGRRAYLWAMTQHMKGLLRRHFTMLFSVQAVKACGRQINFDDVMAATSLIEVDDHYTRKLLKFDSVEKYYRWASCSHVMCNIEIPVFFLNARDDPLVPQELLRHPQTFVYKRDNAVMAVTQHGGHLGYFEGGVVIPETITWLDKIVVEYANAVIQVLPKTSVGMNACSA